MIEIIVGLLPFVAIYCILLISFQCVHWNEDIGEWQLKCVAYSGNNMRKQTPAPDKEKDKVGYTCALQADMLTII